MKSKSAFAVLSTCAMLATAGPASADSPREHRPPPRVRREARVVAMRPGTDTVVREESVPNAPLIVSGAVLLGASYTTSLIVARTSEYGPDANLVVPIAGPWLNLADRADCRAPGTPSCTAENTNKVLLVADGILQGVGALQILGGFVFPAKRTVIESAKPGVHVSPQIGLGTIGLTASGRF